MNHRPKLTDLGQMLACPECLRHGQTAYVNTDDECTECVAFVESPKPMPPLTAEERAEALRMGMPEVGGVTR